MMLNPHRPVRRFLLLVAILVTTLALASTTTALAAPSPSLTADEQALFDKIDGDYAWNILLKQVYGWGVPNYEPWWNQIISGTTSSAQGAAAIAGEMQRLGLQPGAAGGGYVEDFPVDGFLPLQSSVTIVSPYTKAITPCDQAFKAVGTGPDGITAPVVNIGYGQWKDFQKAGDIRGKIVLFHRENPLFYGEPVLAEAKARGAVGALMDLPQNPKDALKSDMTGPTIPNMFIRGTDWDYIASELAAGKPIEVHLVVSNAVGYYPMAHNVVGVIPGSVYPNEYVYLSCHFDHWSLGASDNSGGVGSLLGLAKAFKALQATGWSPQRTLVFVAFDAEEMNGAQDSFYDWCIGSFAHIVGRLPGPTSDSWDDTDLLPSLHPDRPGKIVAVMNMDPVGIKNPFVYVESTPDVTGTANRAAIDSGLRDYPGKTGLMIFSPPSSYDEWQFYMKGVPCMSTDWTGSYYKTIYHTTDNSPENCDPANLYWNMRFNGLLALRFDKTRIVKYDLAKSIEVANKGISDLLAKDRTVLGAGKADISALKAGVATYSAALSAKSKVLGAKGVSTSEAARVNRIQLQCEMALLPHLYNWDTRVIPGWSGMFLFDTYGYDLAALNQAISALQAGDTAGCAAGLAGVTTMAWGREVGDAAYADVMHYIAYNKHLLWAYGYMPQLTDVHREYMSLMGRYSSGAMTKAEIMNSLVAKRAAIYQSITAASQDLGSAFTAASAELRRL
jgi:hypothetical protein